MSLSIGQQLKTARIDRNLTLDDIFKATHIRLRYLEALEENDFASMPSPVQGRGFLRLYAQYLGLDARALLAELQHYEQEQASFAKIEETFGAVPDKIERREPTDILSGDEETEGTPSFWRQLLTRLGVTLSRPVADPVQKQDAAPMPEASPISAPEPDIASETSVRVPKNVQFEPSQAPEESRLLFAKIGATLRERRELLSLTHTEIEGHIHLRPRYMEALEAGNFDSLPSPVQTRGMLSNYAEFLDLDTEALLLQFAEGLQLQRMERNINIGGMDEKRSKRRFSLGGFIAPDLIFGVGVIVMMLAFFVWGLGRIANTRVEEAGLEATAPSIAEVLLTTPTAESLLTPTQTLVVVNTPDGEGTPVDFAEEAAEGAISGVQVLVTVLERSWIRVTVDGEIEFEGRAQPDATFVYEGAEIVEILTANGAGVRIAYNQQDLGLMGGCGEVVQRLYGPLGLLTPTVTPTSNATFTPSPTATPSPTVTPLPVSSENQ